MGRGRGYPLTKLAHMLTRTYTRKHALSLPLSLSNVPLSRSHVPLSLSHVPLSLSHKRAPYPFTLLMPLKSILHTPLRSSQSARLVERMHVRVRVLVRVLVRVRACVSPRIGLSPICFSCPTKRRRQMSLRFRRGEGLQAEGAKTKSGAPALFSVTHVQLMVGPGIEGGRITN